MTATWLNTKNSQNFIFRRAKPKGVKMSEILLYQTLPPLPYPLDPLPIITYSEGPNQRGLKYQKYCFKRHYHPSPTHEIPFPSLHIQKGQTKGG